MNPLLQMPCQGNHLPSVCRCIVHVHICMLQRNLVCHACGSVASELGCTHPANTHMSYNTSLGVIQLFHITSCHVPCLSLASALAVICACMLALHQRPKHAHDVNMHVCGAACTTGSPVELHAKHVVAFSSGMQEYWWQLVTAWAASVPTTSCLTEHCLPLSAEVLSSLSWSPPWAEGAVEVCLGVFLAEGEAHPRSPASLSARQATAQYDLTLISKRYESCIDNVWGGLVEHESPLMPIKVCSTVNSSTHVHVVFFRRVLQTLGAHETLNISVIATSNSNMQATTR